MKTTQQKKDEFVSQGSEIEQELVGIFGRESLITIADIGACEGLSTVVYSQIFPNAQFVVFEPILENYDEMMANFRYYGILNRIIHAIPYAVGDKKETREIWKSYGDAPGVVDWETGNKSSSLLTPKKHHEEHRWCNFSHGTSVQVVSLDSITKSANLTIDFAHIDVQGAEMMVLKGGQETFKETRAIWLEVANIELYNGQPLKRDIQIYLEKQGMKCTKDTCGREKSGDMLWRK